MPVNINKYPKNWSTEIRPAVLARDNNRCAFCGVTNYAVKVDGQVLYQGGSYADAREWSKKQTTDLNVSVVVLTIAHLHDPDPKNCSMDNLAALCQKCHNQHDRPMRLKNAAETRRKKRIESGQLPLFET